MGEVNSEYIVLGRESRGYTQKEFAKELEVEQGTLSKIENGVLPLNSILLEKISKTLNFPPEFFFQMKSPERIQGHFRKKISLPTKDLKKSTAIMTIIESNILKLLEAVEIPSPNIPKWNILSDGSPTEAAKYARNFWKITKGRITDLSKLLEDNGILIVPIESDLDGLSTYLNRHIPTIFLNKNKTGDRQRFTLAHEFGHLVMHWEQKVSPERDIEDEANEFASELLLPEASIAPMIPSRLSLDRLEELKRYWLISMQAILIKAKNCHRITYNQYVYIMKQISMQGKRLDEGIYTPPEKPALLKEIFDTYSKDLNYSVQDLANFLFVSIEDLENIYFDQRIKLKVIKNINHKQTQ